MARTAERTALVRRWLLILGLVVAGIVAGTGPAMAAPPTGWLAIPVWYSVATQGPGDPQGSYTGWSENPHHTFWSNQPGYEHVSVALSLSEPYYVNGGVAVSRAYTHSHFGDTGVAQVRLRFRVICFNGLNEYTQELEFARDLSIGTSNESGLSGVHQAGGASTALYNCPSSDVPVGLDATASAGYLASGVWVEGQSWHVVWYADSQHKFERPDPTWCRAVFGINYGPNSPGVVAGVEVTASAMGCMTDYLTDGNESWGEIAWATDFQAVCANPPEATWSSFSWLGDWIGHYTTCLFNPRGGMNTQLVSDAMDDGWMGDIRTAVGGVGDAVGSWSGSCGTLVSSLPLGMGSVSSCEIQEVWPTSMRNLAGLALVGFTTITCAFILIRMITGNAIVSGRE